ncbi:unnamed protein product [Allacma fusca]|uniref:C2H2-type domain-containing protein n=1 Tax=Allacma fusca TaxID=39272 RepID=A0A8J2KRF1_9HEXA|nr:unnamed protein product [Allacma fusca]
MKLNSAGGLLQINVGSHNGPPPHAVVGGGHGGGHTWTYMMPQTPDGVPVTSSSGLNEETLDAKLGNLHSDLPPDLTELKSLYPGEYQLTTNDPHMPQMGVVPSVRPYNPSGGGGGGGGGGGNGGGASAVFDLVTSSTQMTPMLNSSTNIKSELADYLLNSDIDDIAALIGSAIADSTVPTLGGGIDECGGVTSSTIDPWTELDAWIESACVIQTVHSSSNNNNNIKIDQDNTIHTSDFHPTLQNLLQNDIIGQPPPQQQQLFHDQTKAQEHFSSSILQSRLQQPSMRQENNNNPRHLSSPQHQLPESTTSLYGLKVDPYTLDPDSPPFDNQNGMGPNSDIQRPHTTHVSPPAVVTSTMGRYRKSFNQRKNYDGFMNGPGGFQDFTQPGAVSSKLSNGIKKRSSKASKLNSAASSCQSLDMVDNGKEKPIHRCGICNRGFLNKSNIKVHLRTHTGEKPFKCDTCGKAFRQKAHLLKHVQIHKRLPRD